MTRTNWPLRHVGGLGRGVEQISNKHVGDGRDGLTGSGLDPVILS